MSSNQKVLVVVVIILVVVVFWMACSKKQENLSDHETHNLLNAILNDRISPGDMDKKLCVTIKNIVDFKYELQNLFVQNKENVHNLLKSIKNNVHLDKSH